MHQMNNKALIQQGFNDGSTSRLGKRTQKNSSPFPQALFLWSLNPSNFLYSN